MQGRADYCPHIFPYSSELAASIFTRKLLDPFLEELIRCIANFAVWPRRSKPLVREYPTTIGLFTLSNIYFEISP